MEHNEVAKALKSLGQNVMISPITIDVSDGTQQKESNRRTLIIADLWHM